MKTFEYGGDTFVDETNVPRDARRPLVDTAPCRPGVWVYGSHPDDNAHVRILSDDGKTAVIAYPVSFTHYANARRMGDGSPIRLRRVPSDRVEASYR